VTQVDDKNHYEQRGKGKEVASLRNLLDKGEEFAKVGEKSISRKYGG